MTRIFLSLAVLSLLALIANLFVGLATGDYQQIVRDELQARQELNQSQSRATTVDQDAARSKLYALHKKNEPYYDWVRMHLFLGVAAALLTLLVNSVAITYFIGTSRWCKEVVDAYRLDPQLEEAGQRVKRQSFRWSLLAIGTIIGLVALGASADPLAWNHESSSKFVTPHYIAAYFAIVVIAGAYWQQWNCIGENHNLIEQIMGLVRQAKERRQAAKDPQVSQAEGDV